MDRQSSIDDAPEIFLSKWRKKFRSMPNDEQTKELIPEKISSKDPLGHVNAVLSTWPKTFRIKTDTFSIKN